MIENKQATPDEIMEQLFNVPVQGYLPSVGIDSLSLTDLVTLKAELLSEEHILHSTGKTDEFRDTRNFRMLVEFELKERVDRLKQPSL